MLIVVQAQKHPVNLRENQCCQIELKLKRSQTFRRKFIQLYQLNYSNKLCHYLLLQ